MLKNIPELKDVIWEEFNDKLEKDAEYFEEQFLQLYRSEDWDQDIPVFNFENNG